MRVSVAATAIMAAFFVLPVGADEQSMWRKNQTFTTESSSAVRPSLDCYETSAEVLQQSGTTKPQQMCEQRGKNLTLGMYTDSDNKKYYAVKVGFDQYYRNIANVSAYDTRMYLRPSDDALIVKFPGAQNVKYPYFSIFRLDDGGIRPKLSNGHGTIEYELNFEKRSTLMELHDTTNSSYYTAHNGYALSENRKYILSWLTDHSIVVTDTISGDMRIISTLKVSGKIDATISDDGRYVALGTRGLVFDTQGCGETYDYAMHRTRVANGLLRTACPMTDIRSHIYSIANITYMGANFYFVDDNAALAFDFPRENPHTHGLIKTEAYNPLRLDYLALGDSYSSGEGDIAKKQSDGSSYYLPGTDTLADNCHQSSRAYPFLLRDAWGIAENRMKSVACSGAELLPDYFGNGDSYLGQNERLAGRGNLLSLRANALTNFTPGHIKQIEFVKKYQPKTVTFTAGGNDVGFANILKYCAMPEMTLGFIPVPFTCGYTDNNGELHGMLYESIDTQASYTTSFLRELKSISPETKVVMVGYPSFVSSDSNCGLNAGYLNAPEKRMINDAVSYMNTKLEHASEEGGALFVNIEDSLVGGRICEGSEFMTDILGPIVKNLKFRDDPNMFHPNAKGHARIADTIEASDIVSKNKPTELADLSTEGATGIAVRTNLVIDDLVQSTSSDTVVRLGPRTFADNSMITAAVFSNKKDLGTFQASNDGSLYASLAFSSVEPGHHVLMLEGISYSGEPLKLYQFITVLASDGDMDGDGIDDGDDTCHFIDTWYDEQSEQDICATQEEKSDTEKPSSDISIPPIVPAPVDDTKLSFSDTHNEVHAPGIVIVDYPNEILRQAKIENVDEDKMKLQQPVLNSDDTTKDKSSNITDEQRSYDSEVLSDESVAGNSLNDSSEGIKDIPFWTWLSLLGGIIVGGLTLYGKFIRKKH